MKKNYFKKILSILLLISFFQIMLFAKPVRVNDVTLNDGAEKPKDRPSVALVLSGGGARGFAHLPVVEYIEELGIPIDMIIGTSIGAIVGGFYSAGYNAKDIVAEFDKVDWSTLFTDTDISPYEHIYGKHGIPENIAALNFGTNFSFKLAKGLTNGQNTYELLKSLLLKIPSDRSFNELDIPFRAVATDMFTGEAFVLQDGDLAEAIRSSMSLPGVFKPMYVDEYCFMDGGLRYNMAINVAKKMGYDIIIAVDISQPVMDNPDEFTADPAAALLNTIAIAQYTVTEQFANQAQLIITPDVTNYGILDFMKAGAIYEEGKKAVEKYRDSLNQIRKLIYPNDYDSTGNRKSDASPVTKISIYPERPDFIPEELEIYGAYEKDRKFIYNQFSRIKDKPLDRENFDIFMTEIYETGNYLSIHPRMVTEDNINKIKIYMRRDDPQEFRMIIGSDFSHLIATTRTLTTNLKLDLQFKGLTGLGSLLSLSGTFLTDFGGELYYMHPLSQNAFLETNVSYLENRHTKYGDEISDYTEYSYFNVFQTNQSIAFSSSSDCCFSFGTFYKFIKTSIFTYLTDPYFIANFTDEYTLASMNQAVFQQYFGGKINLNISKIDSKTFASKGFYMNANTKVIVPLNITNQYLNPLLLLSTIEFTAAFPIEKRLSVSVSGFGGTNFLQNSPENIFLVPEEGFASSSRIYFPAITETNHFGTNIAALSMCVQIKPFDHLTIFGGDLFFRILTTAGVVNYDWAKTISIFYDNTSSYPILWSGAFGVGLSIRESFNIQIRFGLGNTYKNTVTPFFSLDIGSYRF